jgi:hypothetical protein
MVLGRPGSLVKLSLLEGLAGLILAASSWLYVSSVPLETVMPLVHEYGSGQTGLLARARFHGHHRRGQGCLVYRQRVRGQSPMVQLSMIRQRRVTSGSQSWPAYYLGQRIGTSPAAKNPDTNYSPTINSAQALYSEG